MEGLKGYIEMVTGSRVKRVFNEEEGKLKVTRKTALPLPYPFNYGFINGTLSEDGDPLDVFVIGSNIKLGDTIDIEPIGLLYVEDDKGIDNKIIAIDASDEAFSHIRDIKDIGKQKMKELKHLLEHNKDGMENRWTKVHKAGGKANAIKIIDKAIKAYNDNA